MFVLIDTDIVLVKNMSVSIDTDIVLVKNISMSVKNMSVLINTRIVLSDRMRVLIDRAKRMGIEAQTRSTFMLRSRSASTTEAGALSSLMIRSIS